MTSDPQDPAPPPQDELRFDPTDRGPEEPHWRDDRRLWAAAAAAIVVVFGLVLALSWDGGAAPAPRSQDTLPVEVAKLPPPPEPPPVDAPLDVLPADMAAAAPVAEPAADLPPLEALSPPEQAEAPAPEPEVLPASQHEGPSFDCRRARSRAELMVCADPVLAEADRRLGAAYRAALAAGVPDWRLERQQRGWLRAREDAARDAPQAVSGVYEARIAELRAQAGAPDWPPSW